MIKTYVNIVKRISNEEKLYMNTNLSKVLGRHTTSAAVEKSFEPMANEELEDLMDEIEQDYSDMESAQTALNIMVASDVDLESVDCEYDMEGALSVIKEKGKAIFDKMKRAIDNIITKISEWIRTKLDKFDTAWLEKYESKILEGSSLDSKHRISIKKWKSNPTFGPIKAEIKTLIDTAEQAAQGNLDVGQGFEAHDSGDFKDKGKMKNLVKNFADGDKAQQLPISTFATAAYVKLWKDYRTEKADLKDMIKELNNLKKTISIDTSVLDKDDNSDEYKKKKKTAGNQSVSNIKKSASQAITVCKGALSLTKERRISLGSCFKAIISAVNAKEKKDNK